MKSIISVENLGKKYVIGEKQAYYSLRDSLGNWFKLKKEKDNEFWALKDINFEIKQGESVGIIGRNGAGKSTLLKILSRITPPTTGKITLRGRVASLLEVGTGFNPELTGRENIYLNGAILGMSRGEIKRKFDEIVAFSEVEKFLDTPVKHYSSGMYMRLAFAVAAHLESEILIVDEVLAVGDAQFQKKCLGKMDEVAKKEGRTVLFVSHNMSAVMSLCHRCILLESGLIKSEGKSSQIVEYYSSKRKVSVDNWFERRKEKKLQNNDSFIIQSAFVLDENERSTSSVVVGGKFLVRVLVNDFLKNDNERLGLIIRDRYGVIMTSFNNDMVSNKRTGFSSSKNKLVEFGVTNIRFSPGVYTFSISATVGTRTSQKRLDYVEDVLMIEIIEGDIYNSGYIFTPDYGLFVPEVTVSIKND